MVNKRVIIKWPPIGAYKNLRSEEKVGNIMNFTELVRAQLEGIPINYSNIEGIYLNPPFSGKSEVRFGQRPENNKNINSKKFFCSNMALTDEIEGYFEYLEYLGGGDPGDCSDEMVDRIVDHLMVVFFF